MNSLKEIEGKYEHMGAASSSSSNAMNDNHILHNNIDSLKKKKVRRKPRSRKLPLNNIIKNCDSPVSKLITQAPEDNKSNDESNDTLSISHLLNEMKITAVKSQVTGLVLRRKQKHFKRIDTKFLNRSNEKFVKDYNLCCNCNCHGRKQLNDVSISRDENKFTAILANKPGGTSSSQVTVPLVNGLTLQCEDTSKNLSQSSIKPVKKNRKGKRGNLFPEDKLTLAGVRFGLDSGQLAQGTIRINAKNFYEAYVDDPNNEHGDYFLPSILDRNRALDGDVVAIKIKPKDEWTERLKTACVVRILKFVHPRTAVGFLQPLPGDSRFAAFIPRDMRIPKMRIPIKSCPQGFLRSPHRFENILYRGRIVDWKDVKYANGELLESIGFSGDLESETLAILADYGLDTTPFPPNLIESSRIIECMEAELAYREDLRKECIFTIDPVTARDLDDAVSCKELNNGNLEIGVHISDVSFYLMENSPLDKIVRNKATTIYMVNNVYHMLPQELCLRCSLLPGVDKLAFSVFWEMTQSGKIVSQRFARTVINSCVQLSYEHAQAMIEDPNRIFQLDELPQLSGGFTHRDLSKRINLLQTIAVNLREKRFENGALRIDQTKVLFRIDEATGEPLDLFVYENKDAHRLIEEFMLLANISVAKNIVGAFPDVSFLRCHDPPKMHMLVEVQKVLKRCDIDIDILSSKNLQSSIWAIAKRFSMAQMTVINHLLAKPMTRARYFCSGQNNDFSHYALSVPIYTHFTSPIRRYADIMVHRLLSATLGYTEAPNWNCQFVTSVANTCNKQKYSAKCAGDASSDLYLAHYVAEHQPFIRDAVVIDVKHTSFEVLVYSTGSIIKLHNNALGKGIECEVDEDNKKLILVFNESADLPVLNYEVKLFSLITVALHRKPKSIKLEATLVRPVVGQVFKNTNSLILNNATHFV